MKNRFLKFILIIFVIFIGYIAYIVLMPLFTSGVDVNLPKSIDNNIENRLKQRFIIKVEENHYYVRFGERNNFIMIKDIDSIVDKYRDLSRHYPDIPVVVEGHQPANYGRVVEVINALQNAGAPTVELQQSRSQD